VQDAGASAIEALRPAISTVEPIGMCLNPHASKSVARAFSHLIESSGIPKSLDG
jgi:hypothetical protein